ncbi:hypothetical protein PPYR_15245 [Photinus pyralis]|uniref:Uncharacterized protein n=1 Tax=Photinus pyralis TaxID=7054 RepID=A0A5N3ZZ85_PHOPY|nr:hypothetical protein PPYR_15245 [Photinus pyralis]
MSAGGSKSRGNRILQLALRSNAVQSNLRENNLDTLNESSGELNNKDLPPAKSTESVQLPSLNLTTKELPDESSRDFYDNNNENLSPSESWLEDSGSEYVPSETESHTNKENLIDVDNEVHDVVETEVDGRKGSKRKSKGQADPKLWKRIKNAKLRVHGKSYTGFEKDINGKYRQTAVKSERKLGPKCSGHQAKSGKGGPRQGFKCSDVSNSQMEHVFTSFWALSSWEAKKSFVMGHVLPVTPKRRNSQRNKIKGGCL